MPTSPSFPPPSFGAARVEHDLLGDLTVPAAAYYGVQTVRALDNFQITGIPLSPAQLVDILRPENITRPRRIPTLASN